MRVRTRPAAPASRQGRRRNGHGSASSPGAATWSPPFTGQEPTRDRRGGTAARPDLPRGDRAHARSRPRLGRLSDHLAAGGPSGIGDLRTELRAAPSSTTGPRRNSAAAVSRLRSVWAGALPVAGRVRVCGSGSGRCARHPHAACASFGCGPASASWSPYSGRPPRYRPCSRVCVVIAVRTGSSFRRRLIPVAARAR
jgi:hypothetical protein